MRIAIGSFQCESNTLVPILTRKEDFDIAVGRKMLDKLAIREYCNDRGIELVPTLYAHALPGGPVAKKDYLELMQAIVNDIPKDGIDGVWLFLHGSMYVEELGSGETYMLECIRKKIGWEIPVSVAGDFHANNSDRIPELCNCICAFRTAPHSDHDETQMRAMRALVRCIEEKRLPKPQLRRADVMIAGDMVQTALPPLKEIMDEARRMEEEIPGMLAVQVYQGHQWVDVSYVGPSFIATHISDPSIAADCAEKLAKMFYKARYDFHFTVEAESPRVAVEKAIAEKEKQVFLSDSGDNTTAGATGDNAFLLNRLREAGAKNFLIAGITDKRACDICRAAEPGALLTLTLGGSLSPLSESATVTGRLVHTGNILSYQHSDGGYSATLDCGDFTVVITEERNALCRPDIFDSIDLDLEKFGIIAVKLGYLFPELAAVAERAIFVFTPGTSPARPEDIPLKNIRRPMFPWDDNLKE